MMNNKKEDENYRYKLESVIKKRKLKALDYSIFTGLIRKLIILFFLIFILSKFIFGIKVMPNSDMSPKIGASDLLIFYRLESSYLADDVVVVKKDGNEYVSRIVAIEGDEVDINDSGLVINGSKQADQDIFYPTGIYEDGIDFPVKIGKDEYFLLGDLREGAMDSRYFGSVNKKEIEGKVFILLRRTNF